MKKEFGDILIAPGKWYTEHDENGIPVKVVYDKTYMEVLGYESEEEYETAQKNWKNRVHPDDAEKVERHFYDVISKHPEGMDYDMEYRIMTRWGYRWFHDFGRCTRRDDGSLEHCDGVMFDIQEIKDYEHQQAHSNLRNEFLDYIINHNDEDPFEMLKQFGQKLRELFNCDQFICRDLEQTRIMVNSPEIEKTWSVPIEFCQQCQHFDAHHPMYKDGYTEMENCQEGWKGIPVYDKCPIKSSLTRIIYCNGRVAGYAAIHYLKGYHKFTDNDRETFEEFIRNFSIALSRYETKRELSTIQEKKEQDAKFTAENYSRVLALEDNLESIYEVELDSGKYLEFIKGDFYQTNVADKLLPKGDYFEDLRGNIDAVIYPEDRDALFNVLDRESIRKALSKTDRVEHFYRMFVGETPLWFKIRIAYKDDDRNSVIIGCFSAEKELAERRMEKQMGDVKRMMNMIQSLSDEYDPIMVLDPETGEYDWYRSMNDDVDVNTSMSVHGDNLYRNIGIDGSTIIHEEDRAQFMAFYTKENMMKVAQTGEVQEVENRWFIQTEGIYRWKYNKAVRMVDETGKAYVVIGVIDTTNQKKEEEEHKQNISLIAALTENNQRVMALEDNFESLYDVELESGHYTGYVKGEFYQSNVVDKLLEPGDYFEDLRGNIDAVIYPEDRDGLFNVLNREAIRKALSEEDRFEYFYRITVDNIPVWFKIRVVYKDLARTSVIIGVFNASKELEAKQIEQQREELKKHKERLQEDMEMIGGLASEYHALYYFNIKEGFFKVYAIDEQRFPEAKQMLSGNDNPVETFSRFGSSPLVHPDDRWKFEDLSLENLKARLAHTKKFTTRFRRRFGDEYLWTEMDVVKYESVDEPANAIGIGFAERDTTIRKEQEQQQLENALEEANAANLRNELVLKMTRSGKWSYGINDKDEVISAQYAESTSQIFTENFFSKPMGWMDYLHKEDKDRVISEFMAAIHDHTGNTPYDVTFRIMDKDGNYRWAHSSGRLIRHEDGTAELFGMDIDITEQIRQQEMHQNQLEAALKKAEVASSAKSSFLFNMSHDIRTPMNAITGFTTMAKKSIDNPELALDYLNKIDVSGQQLLMLINQVLEMARIESGKIEFNEHPVNIKERYKVMVTVLSEQAAVHGLTFTSDLKDMKHFNVFADDTRMSQITLNIVGNAIKYTPEGGSIDFSIKEIEARRKGFATFVFSVADTGIGMSKEYLKTLYDPFSREKSSTVSQIQGTGLGMSIVKNLVDLAGGKIEVESEPGKGTRFDITMDFRINDQATDVEEVKLDISSFNLEGKRALLVEDNEMNREIARFILEDKGIVIEEAEDGDIAVQRIQELSVEGNYNYFDFILMDVQMPRMDGFEATARIRKILDPLIVHIPIIALSANAFEEDRKKSRKAGMDDHIAKPIDVQELWETLAKYL